MKSPQRVGIDTGGTFTDSVRLDSDGGFEVFKCPTTPDEPSRAVLRALAELSAPGQDVLLVHGTTHATNALLTGQLGKVAFITTQGFADVLAIGRQEREDLYCLTPKLRRPQQDRRLIFEVKERLDADGEVIHRLEKDEVERIVAAVARRKPEAIAISFLHSYLNGIHERRMARALKKLGVPVVLSSVVAGEHREYERFTTAWADASLAPVVGPALTQLDRQVKKDWGKASQVRIMRSDGGTASIQAAAAEPVHLALSGPAGGLSAANTLAQARGDAAILTLDMGGTSTDVALLGVGELPLAPMKLGGLTLLSRGLPIHSVGTGGGSLASWDSGGALNVGPASAGAVPGPVCYGRGGKQPTVTDAHLVCGRLHPQRFLGGGFELDPTAANRAISELGRASGISAAKIAQSILEIASADMERALRRVSLAEGFDPRQLTLYAFGGAGGLHAAWVGGRLGMKKVVMPPMAGAFSAVGLLAAPPRRTLVQAVLKPLPSAAQRKELFAPLEKRLRHEMKSDGVSSHGLKLRKVLELRSEGQAAEFPLLEGPKLKQRFHEEHQRRFGYRREDCAILLVNLRLQIDGPAMNPWHKVRCRKHAVKPVETRTANLPEGGGRCKVDWYVREELKPGAELRGPAIVAEYSGTTVVPKGWRAKVDGFGALEMEQI